MGKRDKTHVTQRRRLQKNIQWLCTSLEAEELNALAVREYNAANFIAVAIYALKRARRSV